MKSIQELKTEISENQKQMSDSEITDRKYNSLSKKNELLSSIIMYLETNPKEEFLKADKSRMLKIIASKESQYAYWSSNICPDDVDVKKRRSIFNRELGLTALKRQVKTISYILQ